MDLISRLADNFLANLHLLAAFAGFWLVDLLAQRRLRTLGLEPRTVSGLTPWLGIGALVGARVVYLLPTASVFYRYPTEVVRINAGLSFYGALAGATVGALLYRHFRGAHFLAITDAYALFLPLGVALFRLTCLLHGVCWGRATDTFLGIQFPGLTIPRYPSELYEGLLALGLFAALLHVGLRRPSPGLLSVAFLLGYAMVRGLIDLTRIQAGFWPKADPWLALAMAMLGLVGLWAALRYSRTAAKPQGAVRQSRRRH